MANHTPPEESGTQREKAGFKQRIKSLWFQALPFAVGLVLYILLGILLWLALDLYIKPGDDSTKKKDLIQALSLIMAGVAGVIGIYFTWRGQRLSQRAQEENQRNTQAQLRNTQEQLRNAQEELSLTREGQITERFTRAIDQLGATDDNGYPRLEIRLGGIYALERIAGDSPERDYSTVLEVLAAYVRENARWPPTAPKKGVNQEAEPTPHNAAVVRAILSTVRSFQTPPSDIQAVLDVFKRLEGARASEKEGGRSPDKPSVCLDLRGTDLRGANLQGAYLKGAVLTEAHLEGAALWGANLEGADLILAHLEKAKLRRANLKEARFVGANLGGAYLHYAHLEQAVLVQARLEGADLSGAYLKGAELMQAHLEDAQLRGANLEGADLSRAGLRGARLQEAHLSGANLEDAELRGANLQEAALSGVYLARADLRRADLHRAILKQAQIDVAYGDETTRLPEGLVHPESWSKSTDEQPNGEE